MPFYQFSITSFRVCRIIVALVCMIAVGCETSRTERIAAEPIETRGNDRVNLSDREAVAASVEQRYLIGPEIGREIGYRIEWQQTTRPDADAGVGIVTKQGDSVYVLDNGNFLSRYLDEDGTRLWRVPIADPIEKIVGITHVEEEDRIYITTGGALLVLDSAIGSQVGKQRLDRIANTPPVRYGQFLIYGGLNGQLIWHSFQIAFQWKAFQVSNSIKVPPLLQGRYVIATGNDGRVMVLRAADASRVWDKRLLDSIVAPPAASEYVLYVASLDQHLWAYELASGRRIWRYLTESPLTSPPIVIGQHVYLQVPNEGLICFEAEPIDSPGGVKTWTAANVKGDVIGKHGGELLVWDASEHLLSVVDQGFGAKVNQWSLPATKTIWMDGAEDGPLYAVSDDGRLLKLVPSN